MIGKIFSFLVLVAPAFAVNVVEVFRPLEGVDPNTLSCDPAGQIFLLLPHFSDCNKFYMCTHGEEVEFNCAANLIFDFKLQTCNWDWATTCILRTPKDDEDIEGSGFGSGDGMLGMYGEEIENGSIAMLTAESSGTVRPISALGAQRFTSIMNCNRADSASRQLPYKGDCQRYWKCVGGVPQAVYCSEGLFFNEKTQQCDFEANTRCVADPIDELQGGEFIVY